MIATKKVLLVTASAILLSACSSWVGKDDDVRLEGKRISVLELEKNLTKDPRLGEVPVILPAERHIDMWPQANGYPHNAMGHLQLAETPKKIWSYDAGADSIGRILPKPIVVNGVVYVMDGSYHLSAVSEDKGKELWDVDLEPKDGSGTAHGGGIGFGANAIFVTTGYGELISVNPKSGEVNWRISESSSFSSAPAIISGFVYGVTVDNKLYAYAADTGERVWSHEGLQEDAALFANRAIASDGSELIVPYSSGELYALNVENGRVAWQESLAGSRSGSSVSNLSDISAAPVIDRGLVLAVSYGGRMAAIDLRRGLRVWDREIGGYNMPWAAGDFIFMINGNSEVVALTRRAGRVRWVSELPAYEDIEDKSGAILWYGPVLAGNHLWVAGSNGELRALSAKDGSTVQTYNLSSGAAAAPISEGGKLFVVTNDGKITAFE